MPNVLNICRLESCINNSAISAMIIKLNNKKVKMLTVHTKSKYFEQIPALNRNLIERKIKREKLQIKPPKVRLR